MWSVEILSPTFKTTSAEIESGIGSNFGKGFILGPLTISPSLEGFWKWSSLI